MRDWIFPQTVEILGNKKVVKDQGKIKVYVGGVEQSGPWVKKIWSKIPLKGDKILVLELGCGALVPLLPKNAKITGVEIDSEMLALGKKYFDLGPVEVKNEDASKFIKKTKQIYDLILVDLYQGQDYPKEFESPEFLEKLSQTVSIDGQVIFNRLTTKTANFELNKFVDKLEKYYTIQTVKKVDFNTLIVCSRREKR